MYSELPDDVLVDWLFGMVVVWLCKCVFLSGTSSDPIHHFLSKVVLAPTVRFDTLLASLSLDALLASLSLDAFCRLLPLSLSMFGATF